MIERHLGAPAMHMPFSLGDQVRLRTLITEAGFADIVIEVVDRTVRYPEVDRFVDIGVAGASAAMPALQQLNANERADLVEAVRTDLAEPLAQYIDGAALVMPLQAHIVVARKGG